MRKLDIRTLGVQLQAGKSAKRPLNVGYQIFVILGTFFLELCNVMLFALLGDQIKKITLLFALCTNSRVSHFEICVDLLKIADHVPVLALRQLFHHSAFRCDGVLELLRLSTDLSLLAGDQRIHL